MDTVFDYTGVLDWLTIYNSDLDNGGTTRPQSTRVQDYPKPEMLPYLCDQRPRLLNISFWQSKLQF